MDFPKSEPKRDKGLAAPAPCGSNCLTLTRWIGHNEPQITVSTPTPLRIPLRTDAADHSYLSRRCPAALGWCATAAVGRSDRSFDSPDSAAQHSSICHSYRAVPVDWSLRYLLLPASHHRSCLTPPRSCLTPPTPTEKRTTDEWLPGFEASGAILFLN
jgi:hypothetical protein